MSKAISARVCVPAAAIAQAAAEERQWEAGLKALDLTPSQVRKYLARAQASRWWRRTVAPELQWVIEDLQAGLMRQCDVPSIVQPPMPRIEDGGGVGGLEPTRDGEEADHGRG